MADFSDDDLDLLNQRYAQEGVPFHARPLTAAADILGSEFSLASLDRSKVNKVTNAYARLYPEVDYTWPGMGTGLAASMDRVRKVTVVVTFGSVSMIPSEAMGFQSDLHWWEWCSRRGDIAEKTIYAFADMYDMVYGIDDQYSKTSSNGANFLGLAAEQVSLFTGSLSQSGEAGSAVLQPICLAAELAMKGALLQAGVAEKELRCEYGHRLEKIAALMAAKIPHRDDDLLINAISKFPDYVGSRYARTNLSRLEIIGLALNSQFVVASSVRRLNPARDIALQVEADHPSPRADFSAWGHWPT